MLINYKKLRAYLHSKKALSLAIISSLLIAYFSYKTYRKYLKNQQKIYYDLYFFSQQRPPSSETAETRETLSKFLTNLQYDAYLSFSCDNSLAGTAEITFFLTQSLQNACISLDFSGKSVHEALINGSPAENLVFERHQLRIPAKTLRVFAENSLFFTFLCAETAEKPLFIAETQELSRFFPCFCSFSAKFSIKLAVCAKKSWVLATSLDFLQENTQKIARFAENRNKIKKIADFCELSQENASFCEISQQIPAALLSVAVCVGPLQKMLVKFNSFSSFSFFFAEKLRQNLDFLKESRKILAEIVDFFEDFFRIRGFRREIRLIFAEKAEKNSLFVLPESLFSEFFCEKRKIAVIFAICERVSRYFCSRAIKVAVLQETELFFAIVRVLAALCFEKVAETGVFAVNLFDKLQENLEKRLYLFAKSQESRVFFEILRDFLERTAIFGLKLEELELCARKKLGNCDFSSLFCGNSAGFADYRPISAENGRLQGILLRFADDFRENTQKLCVFRVFFLDFAGKTQETREIREKSLKIAMVVKEKEVFCDFYAENLQFSQFFAVFREDCPQIYADLRLSERFFSDFRNDFIRNVAFSAISKSFSRISEGFSQKCAEFMQKFDLDFSENPQLFERVAVFFLDLLEKREDFSEKAQVFAAIFEKTLRKLQKIEKKCEFFAVFRVLVASCCKKSHVSLLISWLFAENPQFLEQNAHFLAETLQNREIFWEILGKLQVSADFEPDFKRKTLENALFLDKFADLRDETAKTRCFFRGFPLEQRFLRLERAVSAKTVAFSSHNLEFSQLFLQNEDFYAGIPRKSAIKLAESFFCRGFLVFSQFPQRFCEEFFAVFRPCKRIREDFLLKYREIRDFLEENGADRGILQLFAREIQEIEQNLRIFY